MHTPWGPSQSQETLAPGLVRVDTAGHGGYHVSEKRWQEIETMFPAFRSWTGRHWLEEDCDWALAPLTWPDLFSSQSIFDALRSAGSRSDGCVDAAWLGGEHGQRVAAIARAYQKSIAGQWEVGTIWAPVEGYPGAWGVNLMREKERRPVVFAEYPRKQFYTDAELDQLTLPVQVG